MKPHGFLILGVIAIALQLGCAKGGNKSAEKPAEAPADKSGQSETLGNGITIQKNADGSLNPESMKTEFRKKYPELNTKCAAMARSFLGSFKTWDFAVDHWTIGKSTTPIANKDMRAKGYDIVYRVYPSDVEVTSDESKSQLIAKMNTGAEVKSVVWDIFPNAAGQCVFLQDINQSERLLTDWIMIVAAPDTDASKSVKLGFQWFDSADKYRAYGEIQMRR